MSRHSRVLCPGCERRRRIRPQLLGRTVVCKKCSTRFLASPLPDEEGAGSEILAPSLVLSAVGGAGSAGSYGPDRRNGGGGGRSAVDEPGESLAEMRARLDLAEESIRGLVDKVRIYKRMASKYGRSKAELLDARAEMTCLRAKMDEQQALAGQVASHAAALAGDLEEARSEVALLRDRVEGLTSDLRSRADDAVRLDGLVAELEQSGRERARAEEEHGRRLDELARAYEEAMAEERSRFQAERESYASRPAGQRDQSESEAGRDRAERDALGQALEGERLARVEAESRAARLADERDRLASEVAAARALASDAELGARRRAEGLEGRIRELEGSLAAAQDRVSEAGSLRGQLDDAIREGAACRAEFEQFRARVDVSFASLRDQANQKIGELHQRLQDASGRMKRLTQELRAALLFKASLQSAVEAGLLSGLPTVHPAQAADLPRPLLPVKPAPPTTCVELESESEWVRTLLDDASAQPIILEGPRPSNGSRGPENFE